MLYNLTSALLQRCIFRHPEPYHTEMNCFKGVSVDELKALYPKAYLYGQFLEIRTLKKTIVCLIQEGMCVNAYAFPDGEPGVMQGDFEKNLYITTTTHYKQMN